mmetsp:Transcript_20979/g.23963  ORF Transcript_20979/g.23963 Transcript_20979/m.23963 type:complete len:356 (+) Transcript_20979:200-1267(+)|eukprot:CAMPEP_0194137128 /NCGR_PEP_ID=MMETSP0152-20130528/7054_1 /TAXON_ID=1049557 /ORGANISM="Thalassiothrix antarctica, Strain L6-D1" /LENGTH=355 /DNA_ID=CAMNT_0038834023 /DNA_START=182 /DNA_END=1249 /DNA_ORIENTATION=-
MRRNEHVLATVTSNIVLTTMMVITISLMIPYAQALNLLLSNRGEVLNLLNHPLQLQLATGDLSLGSFRRLVDDRKAILEGMKRAVTVEEEGEIKKLMEEELNFHETASLRWLRIVEEAGKTIDVDGVECYNCGESHLNIDCPDDMGVSQSAQALSSIIQANGLIGATAVLRCYSFSCERLLDVACAENDANDNTQSNDIYHGWLDTHAKRWSKLADICEEKVDVSTTASASSSYSICLSMLYNWIDNEAATTGIRADLQSDPLLLNLMNRLEVLEPGYAAQRDKHSSFIADITGKASSQILKDKAADKVNAATAYLASKKEEKYRGRKGSSLFGSKGEESKKATMMKEPPLSWVI